jgi:hypothetical protein
VAPGYPQAKWDGVVGALSSVVNVLESDVAFGLMLYPALDSNECGPGQVSIAPAFNNGGNVSTVLQSFDAAPNGATPTAMSLQAAADWLQQHPPERPRVVLLATDGGPNCNEFLDPFTCICTAGGTACADNGAATACLDDDNAVAAVARIRALDTPTYVVGVPGVEAFGGVLDAMAEAGGTALSGPEKYYLARDIPALEGAVRDIGRRAVGCVAGVGDALVDGGRIDVVVSGEAVRRDPTHTDGYDVVFIDGVARIEFYGDACDAWAQAGSANISACVAAGVMR